MLLFVLGCLVGVVCAGMVFLVWTWAILREERRIADRAACTPDWCPMMIETDGMTDADIEAISCCSKPHEPH